MPPVKDPFFNISKSLTAVASIIKAEWSGITPSPNLVKKVGASMFSLVPNVELPLDTTNDFTE